MSFEIPDEDLPEAFARWLSDRKGEPVPFEKVEPGDGADPARPGAAGAGQPAERARSGGRSGRPAVTAQGPVRDPRKPPPGSPATVYPSELLKGRRWLDRLRVHHLDLVQRFLKAADGQLYTIDLLLVAAMSRSYSIIEGFINAFDTWNPIVAAPLLRMQIDTLVRVAYMAHAPHADVVALRVLEGVEFRHLRDADQKLLTDRRLLEHAEEAHPWVSDVYRATSGWVHFSPEHVHASWRAKAEEEPGTISGWVPIQPEDIPLRALQELLGAMTQATQELFAYVEIWESQKGLPSGETRDLR